MPTPLETEPSDSQPREPGLSPAERHRARRLAQRLARRERARRRILKTTAILPSLFTMSNGLLGFAAIHLATRQGIEAEPALLGVAAWLLFAAMLCDMLDGRVARFTRRTSDFGGQLDSMCDVVSFGVAPPVLMLRTVMSGLHTQALRAPWLSWLSDLGIERALWCVGAIYVTGAAIRLARFNVENEPDESAHMNFRGLPSPGAAAAVATLVLLFDHLGGTGKQGWVFGRWLPAMSDDLTGPLCAGICILLPLMTLATGLLMVSRFRYSHVVNQYIRGKRPLNYLFRLVVVVLLAVVVEPYVALAAAATLYALSAPLHAAWRRLRRPAKADAGPPRPGSPPARENAGNPL